MAVMEVTTGMEATEMKAAVAVVRVVGATRLTTVDNMSSMEKLDLTTSTVTAKIMTVMMAIKADQHASDAS